jgi:hypothetical protein
MPARVRIKANGRRAALAKGKSSNDGQQGEHRKPLRRCERERSGRQAIVVM